MTRIVLYIFMVVYTCLIIFLLKQDCNTVSFWLGTILLMDEGYSILKNDLNKKVVENKQEEETEEENKIEIYRWKDYWR